MRTKIIYNNFNRIAAGNDIYIQIVKKSLDRYINYTINNILICIQDIILEINYFIEKASKFNGSIKIKKENLKDNLTKINNDLKDELTKIPEPTEPYLNMKTSYKEQYYNLAIKALNNIVSRNFSDNRTIQSVNYYNNNNSLHFIKLYQLEIIENDFLQYRSWYGSSEIDTYYSELKKVSNNFLAFKNNGNLNYTVENTNDNPYIDLYNNNHNNNDIFREHTTIKEEIGKNAINPDFPAEAIKVGNNAIEIGKKLIGNK